MLKAKHRETSTKRKDEAMREVVKEDRRTAFYVRIPRRLLRKINLHNAHFEIENKDWFIPLVEEYFEKVNSK